MVHAEYAPAAPIRGWKALALAFCVAGSLLGGCATAPTDPQAKADFDAVNDPLEPVNRALHEFNQAIDYFVLKPVAFSYRTILPPPLQDSVRNALRNLKTPVVLANDLLQGEMDRAGDTVSRFAINSTIGILGLFDVAETWFGIPYHAEDFGQTLAIWGVGEGPYIVLPLLGPSNPRDTIGIAVDSFADPLNWYLRNIDEDDWIYARLALTGVSSRADLLDTLNSLEKTSLDYYVTLRTVYRQRRADEIKNRPPTTKGPAPTISQAADAGSEIERKPASQ